MWAAMAELIPRLLGKKSAAIFLRCNYLGTGLATAHNNMLIIVGVCGSIRIPLSSKGKMWYAMSMSLPSLNTYTSISAAQRREKEKEMKGFGGKRKEQLWRCVEGCGACCKLDKGPSFATPEEIFADPADIQLYRSLIGPDGWCINYDKTTRKCSIYPDRPYFCRVEADVFLSLYGIRKKKFNKEACSSCRDTIKSIYGPHSKELDHFNTSLND